jgi:hypothetical protein
MACKISAKLGELQAALLVMRSGLAQDLRRRADDCAATARAAGVDFAGELLSAMGYEFCGHLDKQV